MTRRVVHAAVASAFLLPALLPAADEKARPLPEAREFLEEVRRNLRSDRLLLEQYTFTERLTEQRLDRKGAVKKVRREVHEVYPSLEPGKMYRRLIERDGVALTPAELAAQDRRQEARTAKAESEEGRARWLAKEEEDRRQEQEVVDELFRMDDLEVAAREEIDGRPAIVVTFSPRPGYRPVTAGGRILHKLSGKAWIDEEDHQLVEIEATLLESLGVGPLGAVRLQPGATSSFRRRKINGEIWLPAEAWFRGAAKVLLVFGGRVDTRVEYGDYKKFSVSTEEAVTTDP